VLATGCLPMGFLSLWWCVVAEVVGRFHRFVARGSGVMEFVFAMKVDVVVGGGWVGCMVVQAETLASVPIGKGCQWRTGAPPVLLFLC
jgi:hypothetical protein